MSLTKAASEPVLRDEDYRLPCNGIGDTGHPKRLLYGPQSKDDGKFSSNMNRIIKQAEKTPGPGKYLAHEDWKEGKANKFSKETRDYKTWATGPSPGHYERADLFMNPSNGSKDCYSNRRKVTDIKIMNGKRRSMTDSAIKHGAMSPGPGHYPAKSTTGENNKKITSWAKESVKTESKKVKVLEPGPGHYQIDYSKLSSEPGIRVHAVPKAKGNNFIDKFVREKWSDVRLKKPLPGPGQYETADFDLNKISRGTGQLQTRGLSRSPMSGYF